MKAIYTILISLFFLCNLAAQKPRPVQIQTVDSSQYVVEYIPIETAQANVAAQLAQVNKQLEVVEKQMAELVKKRDGILQQKNQLEYLQAQLNQAQTTPPPPVQKDEQPAEKKKPKKKKN